MRPFKLPLVALLSVPLLCGMAIDSSAADSPASKKSGTATSKSSPATSSPAARNGAARGSTSSPTTTRAPSFIRARQLYGGSSSQQTPVRPTQNSPGAGDGPRLLKPSIEPLPSAPQDGAFGDDSSREYLPPDDDRPRTFRDDDAADEPLSRDAPARATPEIGPRGTPTYRDENPSDVPNSQPRRFDSDRNSPPPATRPFPADDGAPALGPSQNRPFPIPHSSGTATAAPQAAPDATRDFWIVSSRNCVQQTNQAAVGCPLDYYRCDRGGRRARGDENQFRQSIPPGTPVCIVVHGSFTDWDTVCEDACATTRWLRAAAPHLPLQVVFFSWPSDPTTVILPPVDVGIMGTRAEFNGMYLSQLVQRVPAESPVSLIGHSHGARAITSCLHLMAGGCVQGYKYPNPEAFPHRMRVVYMAGAIDHHWLLPGERYGRALQRTEGVLNVRNCQDWALGFYEWRRPFAGAAIGRIGLTDADRRALGVQAGKVREMEVGRLLGNEHLWPSYLRRPEIAAAAVPYVYFEGDLNEGQPPAPQPGSQLGPNDAVLGAPAEQPFPDSSQPSTQPYRAPSSTQPFQDDAPRTYRSDDTEGDSPLGTPSNEITRRPFSSSPYARPNAGSSAATRRLTPAPDAARSQAGIGQPGPSGRTGAPAGYPNASQPNTSNRNPTNLLPWWPNNGWNGNGWNNGAWSGSGTRPATAPSSNGTSPYPSAPRPNGVVAPTQPNGTSPFDTPIGVRPNLSTPSPSSVGSPGALPRPRPTNPATLLPPTTSVGPRVPGEGSLTPLAPSRSLEAAPSLAPESEGTYPVHVDEPPREAPRFRLPSIFRRHYPEASRDPVTNAQT